MVVRGKVKNIKIKLADYLIFSSVKAIEIASKTDDVARLVSQNEGSIRNLGLSGHVIDPIATAFKFTSPVKIAGQRTIGVSSLKVNSIGASGIAGGNAITGINNYNSSGAGGGFVLLISV